MLAKVLPEDLDSISSLFSQGFNAIYAECVQRGSGALVPEGRRAAQSVELLLH